MNFFLSRLHCVEESVIPVPNDLIQRERAISNYYWIPEQLPRPFTPSLHLQTRLVLPPSDHLAELHHRALPGLVASVSELILMNHVISFGQILSSSLLSV